MGVFSGSLKWFGGSSASVASAVATFFALKLVLGLAVLIVGARALSVADFAVYTQLLVLLAFLVTIATAGVQHGVIRQVAVAGKDDGPATPVVVRAALAIWAAVGLPLAVLGVGFAPHISSLLVGSPELDAAVAMLTLFAIGSGLGTLFCAILTGEGRPVASLSAQAAGLVPATAATLILLFDQRPVAAAVAFAAGPLLTTLAGGFLARRTLAASIRQAVPVMPMARQLIGYSGAFLVTAALMPLTLLALRAVYRDAFGLEVLGYWLAANRISDVNTQLLGLYLSQEYLPKAARATAGEARRPLVLRTAFIASAAMLTGLAVFSLAPEFWIATVLSAKYLPAVGMVWGYLIGDLLRVGASLLSYTALADRHLKLYVGLEAAAAALVAAGVLAFVAAGIEGGPAISYMATYALLGVAGAAVYAIKLARKPGVTA